MHRSAGHALEAFLIASNAREEAIWARRLRILLSLNKDDGGDDLLAIDPLPTLDEALEVVRLKMEMADEGARAEWERTYRTIQEQVTASA